MYELIVRRAMFDCHSSTFCSASFSISFICPITCIICSWTILDFSSYVCLILSSNFSNSASSSGFPSNTGNIYIPFVAALTWKLFFIVSLFRLSNSFSLRSSYFCLIRLFSFSKSSLLKVLFKYFFISSTKASIVVANVFPSPAGRDIAIGSFGLSKLYR